MSCDNDGPCVYEKERPLTFSEAMALDPGEVEVLDNVPANAPRWKLLAACLDGFTMSWFRTARFRHARRRRSRVQEMAEAESIGYPTDVPLIQQTAAHYIRAIRAVCEYIRTETIGLGVTWPAFVASIEREFLEPR